VIFVSTRFTDPPFFKNQSVFQLYMHLIDVIDTSFFFSELAYSKLTFIKI